MERLGAEAESASFLLIFADCNSTAVGLYPFGAREKHLSLLSSAVDTEVNEDRETHGLIDLVSTYR